MEIEILEGKELELELFGTSEKTSEFNLSLDLKRFIQKFRKDNDFDNMDKIKVELNFSFEKKILDGLEKQTRSKFFFKKELGKGNVFSIKNFNKEIKFKIFL